MCTRVQVREGVADTPTEHVSKLTPVLRSSSAQRGILIEAVYSLKLGTFRVPGGYRHEAYGRSILVNSEVNMGQF